MIGSGSREVKPYTNTKVNLERAFDLFNTLNAFMETSKNTFAPIAIQQKDRSIFS